MPSPDRALGPILDRFPASELISASRFVRALILFREVNELGLLHDISLEQLAARDLSRTQVNETLKVLCSVHSALYGKPDGSAGIGVAVTRPPTLSEDGRVSGLAWLPLQRVDEELSKREHTFPQNRKINVRISRAGDVSIADDPSIFYSLKLKEVDYLRFIRASGKPMTSLKHVASNVGATTSNVSRDIGKINKNIMEKLELQHKIIDWRPSVGFFLNSERYNILFD